MSPTSLLMSESASLFSDDERYDELELPDSSALSPSGSSLELRSATIYERGLICYPYTNRGFSESNTLVYSQTIIMVHC